MKRLTAAQYPMKRLAHARPSSVSRHRVIAPRAFVSNDGQQSSIKLPLDYYKLLSVNRASSKEMVRRSYDRIIKSPTPDLGYSEDALYSRAVLLKTAVDTLSEQDARRGYDQRLFKEQQPLEVSVVDAVGALILLQESGQFQPTIEAGHHLLQHKTAGVRTRDVAIATALAYCDRAAEAAEMGATATAACTDLEAALQLLEKHDSAPQVQAEIVEALEELAPRYATELTCLPLDQEHAAQRAKGCTILRHLLWGRPEASSDMAGREALLEQARCLLTAQEQIALYTDIPEQARVSASEVLDTALAYIAHGFATQQPAMVQRADELLSRVASAAQELPQEEGVQVDVALQRAVCAVLLGSPAVALQVLGLAEGCTPPSEGTLAQAAAYVQENAGPGGEVGPGLEALAQAWLREAALASFRETAEGADGAAAGNVTLADWFEASAVKMHLQVASLKERVSPGGLWALLQSSVAGLLGGAQGQQEAAPQQQQQQQQQQSTTSAAQAVPPPPPPSPRKPVRQQVPLAGAGAAGMAAAAAAAATAARLAPLQPATMADPAQLREQLTGAGSGTAEVPARREREPEEASVELNIRSLAAENVTVQQLKSRLSKALEVDKVTPPPAAAAAAAPAAGEQQQQVDDGEEADDEAKGVDSPVLPEKRSPSVTRSLKQLEVSMWDTAPEDPWAGFVKGAVRLLGGAALVMALLHVTRSSRQQAQAPQPQPPAPAAVVERPGAAQSLRAVPAAAATLAGISKGEVDSLLRRWVQVRSAALGSQHEAALLPQVLAGPMLGKYQALVPSMKQQGLSWQYELKKLAVQRVVVVQAAAAGQGEVVEAAVHVQEAARMLEGDQEVERYDTDCEMVYRLQQGAEGWRLVECKMPHK